MRTPASAYNRVPVATYRLQFHPGFNFAQAQQIAAYLRDLGASDLYAAPLFKARPQSTHGYDVCGFQELNSSLGSLADFQSLSARLHSLGMGLLLDLVPNHMGTDLSNSWWRDVLEHGRVSLYADWFDIDWRPLCSELQDKILLPVLEDLYAHVLEAGKLKLLFQNGRLALAYYDRQFPVAPRTYSSILRLVLANCRGDPQCTQFVSNLSALLQTLSACDLTTHSGHAEFLKALGQLREWHEQSPLFRSALERTFLEINGTPGDPHSFDRLHALLQQQHYRLAHWRLGPEEINYRRFFDVLDLVCLRMELPQVFDQSHLLVFSLLKHGQVTGLRIDHPDGLWDPREYFRRLQSGFRGLKAEADEGRLLFLVAEKILTGDEDLPHDWPVAGTTGYDFLCRVNGLFIDHQAQKEFDSIYRQFAGEEPTTPFPNQVYDAKLQILNHSLVSELNALTHRLKRLATSSRYSQDFPLSQLRTALAAIIAAFPVYRTYTAEDSIAPSEPDCNAIDQAVATAREFLPNLESALQFIREQLLLQPRGSGSEITPELREFVLKFQQLTGPVMAKGFEDTTFYRFNRFLSLNEVGGQPDRFGFSIPEFHQFNLHHARHWPHSLLSTATHDTKRGEDVRARLNVLSEMPREWSAAVLRWKNLNAKHKTLVCDLPAPSPNDEYLFYQTLVGAWLASAETQPGRAAFVQRISAYLLKAAKEAKTHTSWTSTNSPYEAALKNFVEHTLATGNNQFLQDFLPFHRNIDYFGRFNSLSQVLLKLTCPGVPDLYQGTELWDFSLVDPDNRRPVDYQLRSQTLAGIKSAFENHQDDLRPFFSQILEDSGSGRTKMFLIWRALQFRNQNPDFFADGDYVPLQVSGPKAEHLCVFARAFKHHAVITVAPRLCFQLLSGNPRPPIGNSIWGDTFIDLRSISAPASLCNVLTLQPVQARSALLRASDALSLFPVALLESSASA